MHRANRVFLALAVAGSCLAGCLGSGSGALQTDIVTAGYPEYFLALRIADGTSHGVKLLGAPGASVHDFDPSASDISTMQHAKIVLIHGMGLESWASRAEQAMSSGGPAFNATAPSPASLGLSAYLAPPPNGDAGLTIDPHTWTDPVGYAAEARNVEAALNNTFPQDAPTFLSNTNELVRELRALDQAFHVGLAACSRQEIVTNHDAYFYLAHQYNFSQISLHGITPDSEATQQEVQDVINAIEQNHIPVVFLEDGTSPSAVQSIVDATHVQVATLSPNEERPPAGQDYFTRQLSNLVHLEEALGCHES
ncbi:MAG: metal ABC transporter substrate-binding protein [Thermoplasmatota archaeon]